MMKINWKRVVIAAVWSELILMGVYFPLELNNFQAIPIPLITLVNMLVFMFLAGYWAVRDSNSYFFLHGLLVGFIANIIFHFVCPIVLPDVPLWSGITDLLISLLHPVKILIGGFGGYMGGRQRKKQPSAQIS